MKIDIKCIPLTKASIILCWGSFIIGRYPTTAETGPDYQI